MKARPRQEEERGGGARLPRRALKDQWAPSRLEGAGRASRPHVKVKQCHQVWRPQESGVTGASRLDRKLLET